MPTLVDVAERLRKEDRHKLKTILTNFTNKKNLSEAMNLINQRLSKLAEKGTYISISPKEEQ
jgi:phosphopantothenate synthetase